MIRSFGITLSILEREYELAIRKLQEVSAELNETDETDETEETKKGNTLVTVVIPGRSVYS